MSFNAVQFLRESKNELSKVKWPGREQTMKYSKMVIVVSISLAVFLGVLDYAFNLLIVKAL